ncbi:hypothetical protein [Cupriavidus sp. AU9028]|uniref:hypothetical protein n=1 Tax=Cupriavidus sp. AU9028 TaxID=2871157 RepID=UPI001C98720D|nr:hypothetical protein [Cupriavidus sp. AU9028]MBY4898853.1 hypothetical protein [Cupriavidus sp. AU9028]
MDSSPSSTYKGYDLYPLVYKYEPPREWHERRPDREYSASVVICEEGREPTQGVARVFGIRDEHWESLGAAKSAALKEGVRIIDGFAGAASMPSS